MINVYIYNQSNKYFLYSIYRNTNGHRVCREESSLQVEDRQPAQAHQPEEQADAQLDQEGHRVVADV